MGDKLPNDWQSVVKKFHEHLNNVGDHKSKVSNINGEIKLLREELAEKEADLHEASKKLEAETSSKKEAWKYIKQLWKEHKPEFVLPPGIKLACAEHGDVDPRRVDTIETEFQSKEDVHLPPSLYYCPECTKGVPDKKLFITSKYYTKDLSRGLLGYFCLTRGNKFDEISVQWCKSSSDGKSGRQYSISCYGCRSSESLSRVIIRFFETDWRRKRRK